jgi:hypothetical protein
MTERKPRKARSPRPKGEEIVRLEDLAPPADIRGGARKRVFGEEPLRRPKRKPGP